jgi:uncharacterized protein with von Willebrand factor type A (vWA) domain
MPGWLGITGLILLSALEGSSMTLDQLWDEIGDQWETKAGMKMAIDRYEFEHGLVEGYTDGTFTISPHGQAVLDKYRPVLQSYWNS